MLGRGKSACTGPEFMQEDAAGYKPEYQEKYRMITVLSELE